jgi:HPt (histidine-containing phosphotransfer) domain-containing protein
MISPELLMGSDPGDPAALKRLLRFGGPSLLDAIVELFRTQVPSKLADCRTAVDIGDATAVQLATHSLRSSSAQLGALSLAVLCGQAESLAEAGELGDMPELLDRIECEYAAYMKWLADVRPTLEAS